VAYTLVFENLGTVNPVIDTADDLTGVLDDADWESGPAVEDPNRGVAGGDPPVDRENPPVGVGLEAVFDQDAQALLVKGTLGAQPVTVRYSVKVRDGEHRGDSTLGNVVAGPEWGPTCEDGAPVCTETPVDDLKITKTAQPGRAKYGDTVQFKVSFENLGSQDAVLAHRDMLGWVLDDGDMVSGPVADLDTVQAVFKPESKRIEVAGTLRPGARATVSYGVKVTKAGDFSFDNFVVTDQEDPGPFDPDRGGKKPDCEQPAVCTVTPIDPYNGSGAGTVVPNLPFTGTYAHYLTMVALALLAAGLVMRRAARQPRRPTS
jgi:hypothetical protein